MTVETNGTVSSRSDGRSDSALRRLALESGLLSRSDGSARFSCGPVQVIASVNGPLEVRLRDELLDRATLEINVVPVRGLPGPSSKSAQKTVHLLLAPLILLHAHPRTLIQITLQTTCAPSLRFSKSFRAFEIATDESDDETPAEESDDAVELACQINAAVAALVDASISMRGIAAAVALSVSEADESDSPKVLLDPSPQEQRDASASFVAAFSFGEGVGGKEGQLVYLETCGKTRGPIDDDVVYECIRTGQVACQSIVAFLRKSVEAQLLGRDAPDTVPTASMDQG